MEDLIEKKMKEQLSVSQVAIHSKTTAPETSLGFP